ncbi:hypothetical protein MBANPS3_004892 [Mucor bainieri]
MDDPSKDLPNYIPPPPTTMETRTRYVYVNEAMAPVDSPGNNKSGRERAYVNVMQEAVGSVENRRDLQLNRAMAAQEVAEARREVRHAAVMVKLAQGDHNVQRIADNLDSLIDFLILRQEQHRHSTNRNGDDNNTSENE